MMPFLVAAVVFVGALCAIDLLLTVAVVRKLREHTLKLARVGAPPALLKAGTELGEFRGTSTNGQTITKEFFSAPTIVALLSVGCRGCRSALPRFTAEVERNGHGPERVLALVSGDDEGAAPFVAGLAGVATVVTEPPGGPVAEAFDARAFPSFYLVGPGGVVMAGADSVGELPIPAAV